MSKDSFDNASFTIDGETIHSFIAGHKLSGTDEPLDPANSDFQINIDVSDPRYPKEWDEYSKMVEAVHAGYKASFEHAFYYDGALEIYIKTVAELSGWLVMQALESFPGLIKRKITISTAKEFHDRPDKHLNFAHEKVTVTVTFEGK